MAFTPFLVRSLATDSKSVLVSSRMNEEAIGMLKKGAWKRTESATKMTCKETAANTRPYLILYRPTAGKYSVISVCEA
jgi:hypothetical protein